MNTINFTADLDEGRWCRVSCLACRHDRAHAAIALPFQMYVGSLDCDECYEPIVEYEHLGEYVVRLDGGRWRAA